MKARVPPQGRIGVFGFLNAGRHDRPRRRVIGNLSTSGRSRRGKQHIDNPAA